MKQFSKLKKEIKKEQRMHVQFGANEYIVPSKNSKYFNQKLNNTCRRVGPNVQAITNLHLGAHIKAHYNFR